MTRLPNGDLWLLNDSGNPADLFKIDVKTGKIIETVRLPVKNYDWEDLTHDPQGRLYIGDFGNNRNARRNLRIFVYDPASKTLDSIQFAYPDQRAFPPVRQEDWNFNCEAMVWHRDSLHLFSKNAFVGNDVCKHYVLPATAGHYTATLRDSMVVKNRVVTGAAIGADGTTLMLVSYIVRKKWGFWPYTRASLVQLSDFKGSAFFRGKKKRHKLRRFVLIRQYESVTEWSPGTWLLANEGKKPYWQKVKRWRA